MTLLARLLFIFSNKVRRVWCWLTDHRTADHGVFVFCHRCWAVTRGAADG